MVPPPRRPRGRRPAARRPAQQPGPASASLAADRDLVQARIAEEHKVYRDRLTTLSALKRFAVEDDDEDAVAKIDKLERQAETVWKKRIDALKDALELAERGPATPTPPADPAATTRTTSSRPPARRSPW